MTALRPLHTTLPHAPDVAKGERGHEPSLHLLLEDCSGFDKALTYLKTLPASQAAAVLQQHGKVGRL